MMHGQKNIKLAIQAHDSELDRYKMQRQCQHWD